jgi:hypothetical protein
MKVAVVGSREFGRLGDIPRFLDHMHKLDPAIEIVSGGADGVDKAAEDWAKARGVPCQVFPANWEEDGDRAGIKRNAQIIEAAQAAVVFWDGESAGTLDSLCRGMKRKDFTVRVFLG